MMLLRKLAVCSLTALHATISSGIPFDVGRLQQKLLVGHEGISHASSVNCSYCPDAGIDIGISYATAVVRYANGTSRSFRAEASPAYVDMMRRLSDPASEHIHPPYGNIFEKIIDQPRQWMRRLSEMALQHASPDVSQIHQLIRSLRDVVERGYVAGIEPAVVTRPRILALYDEDIVDALKYNGLLEKRPDLGSVRAAQGCPMPRHPITVAIGSGVLSGELKPKEHETVLSVLYTKQALQVQQQTLTDAERHSCDWEESEREDDALLSWELGSDSLQVCNVDEYWDRVRAFLLELPSRDNQRADPITKVVLHGESANSTEFVKVVNDTVTHRLPQEYVPDVICDNTMFVAAKGAMMLAEGKTRLVRCHSEHLPTRIRFLKRIRLAPRNRLCLHQKPVPVEPAD